MRDVQIKQDDELLVFKTRLLTIARLLEEFANSDCEGALPSSKRHAWIIAQGLKTEIKNDEVK